MRWSLRWKLGLGAVLISAVPLLLTGWFLLDINRQALVTENRTLRLAIADDIARTITDTLTGITDDLFAVGTTLVATETPHDTRLAMALTLVNSSRLIDHVAIYDPDGQLVDVIRTTAAQDVPVPQTLDPMTLVATESGSFGQPATAQPTQNTAADPLRPILVNTVARIPRVVTLTVNDKTTGYLTTWAKITPIEHRIERLALTLFPETYAAISLVDDHRQFLVHTDPDRVLNPNSHNFLGPLQSTNPADFQTHFAITSDYVDESGQSMVGSAVKVTGVPWAVIVRIRSDIAYASLHRMRTVIAATVGGLTIVSLLLGVFLAHFWLRPLNNLVGLAKALSQRAFSSRVPVSQSDELGILAHAMNQAAADLEHSEHQLRQELSIRADLGRYLPAAIVEKIIRREQDMSLGGKRQMITVVFADVVSFTPLVERLPPEVIVSLLNELFTVLSEVIFRHGGTVDKFIGDCVMALFGAPEPTPDHAKSAVRTAEDMLAFVESANVRWEQHYGVAIQIAIGIHAGEAVIGNIGSAQRMEYTAIGDVINIAARLETLAQPRQILVTEQVRLLAGSEFEYNDLGFRTVTGKETPVHIFEVRS